MTASSVPRFTVVGSTPEGFAVSFAPPGFNGLPAGLAIVAIVCVLIGGLMSGAVLSGLRNHPEPAGFLYLGLFIFLATVVPLACVVMAFHFARRNIILTVSRDAVAVCWSGPIRRTEKRYPFGAISGMDVVEGISAVDGKTMAWLYLRALPHDVKLSEGPEKAEFMPLVTVLAPLLRTGHPPLPGSIAQMFPPPPAAKFQMADVDGMVTLLLRPKGLWSGPGVAAIIGGTFTLYLAFAAGAFLIDRKPPTVSQWIQLLLEGSLGPLWLAFGLHEMRRRYSLVITPTTLVYRSAGPLHVREYAWALAEIRSVDIGVSHHAKNPCYRMVINANDSRRSKDLFDGREAPELAWLQSLIEYKWRLACPSQV